MDTDLSSSPTTSKSTKKTCLCCRIKFEYLELQRAHFKTDWHLYNLKRKICQLEPIDLISFQEIQAAAPKSEKGSQSVTPNEETISVADDDDSNEDDWVEIDLVDEEEEEEEAAEMLARVIKFNVCLFCGKKSNNMKNNISHMSSIHGFFIPEEQYLIDLDGLMEYLGFKVGAGTTCLWCNKQFKTVHGVRLHMVDKDHCKIYYNQEKAIEEFKEFYDYSSQEQIDMKPLSQLAIPKRSSLVRAKYNKDLVAKQSKPMNGLKHIVPRGSNLSAIPGSYRAKNIKRFEAYRAKIILRTGMANNDTMRGRLRQQNPI